MKHPTIDEKLRAERNSLMMKVITDKMAHDLTRAQGVRIVRKVHPSLVVGPIGGV